MRKTIMASPELRSPFVENVMNILQQGDDKALKQAFYNTGATLFAVIVCGGAVAVYFILEAFLKPLLWAVLCGTFLHPFKHTLTYYVTRWLQSLRESGTPLVLGTVLLPLQVVDRSAEVLGSLFFNNLKLLFYLAISLPCMYLFYRFAPLQLLFTVLTSIFHVVYNVLGYFSAIWVWTLAIAYLLMVVFFWTPQSSHILRPLSVPVWIALLLHLAAATGPLRVPLFIAVTVFLTVGFVSAVNEAKRKHAVDSGKGKFSFWRFLSAQNQEVSPPPETTNNLVQETIMEESQQEGVQEDKKEKEISAETKESTSDTKRPENLPVEKPATVQEGKTDLTSSISSKEEKKDAATDKKPLVKKTLSDHCFVALFWAIGIVQIWQHRGWFLPLMPLLIVCLVLKRLGVFVSSLKVVQEKCELLYKRMSQDSRLEVLVPKPIEGLGKLIIRGDGKIVAVLESSMDKFISILIVLLVLVGTVLMSLFLVIQFHRESMHLVSVSSNILNNSLHPELTEWLPDNEVMQTTIDSMVGNAYIYGREYIADKAKSALGEGNEQLEEQILHIFDQVYEKYVARNATNTTNNVSNPVHAPLQRRMSLSEIDVTNVSALWDIAKKSEFNLDLDIWSFVQENIGVFMQVMESIWLVLRSNLSLCMNILTAIISVILGGGTAILNFVISMVIFITTLFYLLAASSDTYLPVEWFLRLSPTQGGSANKFGQAVEEAIGSVFLASFKMATFYGMYTWLTHTVFGIHVVYIPAALAAVFAAIPFLGTYWAAFPAIIELWLVNGQGMMAILLLLAHFLPSLYVDTVIYSEIKGGHPFLTGLAIAGGIYWLGLEGAIIGPILLCCLVVAVNVFGSMMSSDDSSGSLGKRYMMKRLLNIGAMHDVYTVPVTRQLFNKPGLSAI